ncbi:hypothetical protein E0F88_23295 [Dyadobacter psychrotolerans]|uniref:Macroglobulin domain-containing protein n=1 Tax=Dyadobacter psychrotolerans TaxID=2541721 RepID=A0A4R5DE69_9BACT|nr:hypothetical protein E0F88_23295 [Dyadobacter psychrotolerans]
MLLLFLTLAVGSARSYGQDDPMVKSLKDRFNLYSTTALQEKIYVHLDRSFYLIGETIWFKAYNLDGSRHRFLDMSKVAYLEILDKENNAVAQTKFSLLKGKGNGSLLIPASVVSGNYKVRCYSNWMKNFGADYFFETDITVVNPFLKFDPEPDAKKEITYDVQFFPEGGYLVKGLESKVAFRAAGPDGKGIQFKGVVVSGQNDEIVKFQPGKFGIGSFIFKPQTTDTYRAIITDSQGKEHTYPLPQVQERGYVMRVTDSTSNLIKVSVIRPAEEEQSVVYLLAHTRQINPIADKKSFAGNRTEFLINRAQLGEGISHMTILNEKLKPVCERLYFKRPEKRLNIEAGVGKPEFATREKVTMNLSAETTGSLTNMSVSVFLTDSIQALAQNDISSYFFLTSDLKGRIEDPAYYFQNNTKETDRQLDDLIISHGWRRFKWEDVFGGTLPKYQHLPEFDGHLVLGKVLNISDNSPAPGIDSYLAALDFPAKLYVNHSDAEGNFMFELKNFTGAKEVTLQTNLLRDSTYKFEISNPFSKQFSQAAVPAFKFDKNLGNPLLTRSINMQSGNSFLPRLFTTRKAVLTDSLAFFGVPDEKYFLDDFTRFPTMEEVLREYVRGVVVRRRDKGFHFRMVDKLLPNTFYKTDPLVLLDGIPVFNVDKIMEIDPLKIKKVELLSSWYLLGAMNFTGIVSFSTYKNDLAGFEPDPRVLITQYEGVQAQREFYAPKYDSQTELVSRLPDFRNLLHWAPNVVTDQTGKAQIQFFTSEQTGSYKVVVQGITEKGVAGSKTFNFYVGKRSL